MSIVEGVPLRSVVAASFALGCAVSLGSVAADPNPESVPTGFAPTSTSWTSAQRGWVLGFAPCPEGSCPALVHTTDGGGTWIAAAAPPVSESPTGEHIRVFFASDRDGLVTDGHQLFATDDSAASWHPVPLGVDGPVGIVDLGADASTQYAVVSSGTEQDARTALLAAPLGTDQWQPVPGVSLPGQGGFGDVEGTGDRAAVSLGIVHESTGYWTRTGQEWRRQRPPCDSDAVTRLDDPANAVVALCASNPGIGFQIKELRISVLGGPFLPGGRAPDAGITTWFGASSPTTATAAAEGGGTSILHSTENGGLTWRQPLTLDSGPYRDLAFQDERHGVLLWGGPPFNEGRVYVTTDSGRSWNPLPLR